MRRIVMLFVIAVLCTAQVASAGHKRNHGDKKNKGPQVTEIQPGSYLDYHLQFSFNIDGVAYQDGDCFDMWEPSKKIKIDASVQGNERVYLIEWYRLEDDGKWHVFCKSDSRAFENKCNGKCNELKSSCFRVRVVWVTNSNDAVRGKVVPDREKIQYFSKTQSICLSYR